MSSFGEFDNAATANMTNANFVTVMEAVTQSVFPPDTVRKQKCWMRRNMRKPRDSKIRDHAVHVEELNACSPLFPPCDVGGAAITALPVDELCDDLD